MSEPKPWQSEPDWRSMTMAEQMSAARDRQASFRLEHEVRKAAKARNLDAMEVDGLVEKARGVCFCEWRTVMEATKDGKREPVRNGMGAD